eukprot:3818605-Rhodomonas_salina.2
MLPKVHCRLYIWGKLCQKWSHGNAYGRFMNSGLGRASFYRAHPLEPDDTPGTRVLLALAAAAALSYHAPRPLSSRKFPVPDSRCDIAWRPCPGYGTQVLMICTRTYEKYVHVTVTFFASATPRPHTSAGIAVFR